ncbi:MAG: phosphatidylserine decarboxylase [Proteobacteria bacterium]|nr:phosphatidylserine decarboxylase [Pseudomonadota bacterium]
MKTLLVPIHRAGWPFIGIFATVAVGLSFAATALGFVGIVLTVWCVYFFRDPDRITPLREGLIISPADGIVQMIDKAPPPKELDMGDKDRWRVCVFMNVFNVHVNRIPIAGTVTALNYRPGKFLNASLDKASELNECQSLGLTLANGQDIAFVQIAGLVARRILCEVSEGQEMKTGERFGMIRFGSRVDVYLPDGVMPLVAVGQTAIAGETVIADIQAKEPARAGEIR